MPISDRIASLLLSMLEEAGGELELKRNEIAERIGCAPSQINYVLASRFTPAMGYRVESRRGGGGYIKIILCRQDVAELLKEVETKRQSGMTEKDAEELLYRAYASGLLSVEAYRVALSAVSDHALEHAHACERAQLRVGILTEICKNLV